ncbi:MAG: histidinol-phosphatase [Myxococcota bacterium]|jgi:histidinol-phosphatase
MTTDATLPDTATLTALRDFATEVAWAGGRRTLAYFNNAVGVDIKADGTPVTIADREAETVMRDAIHARFPSHGVVGEEHGVHLGDSDYRWILDPIDGTKAFIRGVPLYGTLVGIEYRGEPVVGVIYMPALDEMIAAAHGLGCTWNGRRCSVNTTDNLGASLVATTSATTLRRRMGDRYDDFISKIERERTWADCYAYVLVATGRAEVALDPILSLWDCGPLLTVIEEAGGRFTSWTGERTITGGEAVATNGVVHEAVLDLIRDIPALPEGN